MTVNIGIEVTIVTWVLQEEYSVLTMTEQKFVNAEFQIPFV